MRHAVAIVRTVTRSKKISVIATLASAALVVPAAAYPPGTAIGMKVLSTGGSELDSRIVSAGGTFKVRVSRVKPDATVKIAFNKKTWTQDNAVAWSESTSGGAKTVTVTLPAPSSSRGAFRIVATSSEGLKDGRTDSGIVYLAAVQASALAKGGRTNNFNVSYVPAGTDVTIQTGAPINGSCTGASFTDLSTKTASGSPASATVSWTPASSKKSATKCVRLQTDGDTIWTRLYKVAKG